MVWLQHRFVLRTSWDGVSTPMIPDASTLARWLVQGAPLGFQEEIERTGNLPSNYWHAIRCSDRSRAVSWFGELVELAVSRRGGSRGSQTRTRCWEQRFFAKSLKLEAMYGSFLGSEPILNKAGRSCEAQGGCQEGLGISLGFEGVAGEQGLWPSGESHPSASPWRGDFMHQDDAGWTSTHSGRCWHPGCFFITFQLGGIASSQLLQPTWKNGVQHFIAYWFWSSDPRALSHYLGSLCCTAWSVPWPQSAKRHIPRSTWMIRSVWSPSAKGLWQGGMPHSGNSFGTEVLGYPLKLSKAHAGGFYRLDWS